MKNWTFLLGLFFLVACGSSVEEKISYADPIEAVENNLIPSVVFEGEAVEPMNILERMEYYKVPGVSIVFFRNDSIEWAKGYGFYSYESSRRIDPYTLFQAASISKPVAAAGVMKLVQTNQLDLDEQVNTYLKKDWQVPMNDFQKEEAVTLRRLLSHRAGVNVHGFPGYEEGEDFPTLVQVLNGVSPANTEKIEVTNTPGAEKKYSGGGYTIVQKIIEDVTGQPFSDYMRNQVLAPMGMANSFYSQPLTPALVNAAAIGHRADGSLVQGKWHHYPELAAAGLWTTPTDLALYAMNLQQIYKGQMVKVLTKNSVQEMLTGVGPMVMDRDNRLVFGHGGANEGFRADWMAFADGDQAGCVIMTNSDNGNALINEVKRSLSKVYGWNYFNPINLNKIELAEEQLKAYAGRYYNESLQMQILIEAKGDHLLLYEIGEEAQKERYYFIGEHEFVRTETNERLKFNFGEANELKGFTYDDRYSFQLIKQ